MSQTEVNDVFTLQQIRHTRRVHTTHNIYVIPRLHDTTGC